MSEVHSEINDVVTEQQPDTAIEEARKEDAGPTRREALASAWADQQEQLAGDGGSEEPTGVESEPLEPTPTPGEEGAQAAASADDVKPTESDEPASASASEAIKAPETWSEGDRDTFSKLPADAQEFIQRRHSDMEKDYQQKVTQIADVRKAIEPYRGTIAQHGVSEAQAIETLFAAQQTLERTPVDGTLWLAQQYVKSQVDAKRVIETLAQQHGIVLGTSDDDDVFAEQSDPDVANLRKELAELRGSVEGDKQRTIQVARSQIQANIDAFRDEKDESGNLLRPHFEAVRSVMQALSQSTGETDLNALYEKAVWSLPETRQQQLESEQKARAEQAKVEAAKKAADAKKKVLPRSNARQVDPIAPKTRREALKAEMQKLRASSQ